MQENKLYDLALQAATETCMWLNENQNNRALIEVIKENPYKGFTKLFDYCAESLVIETINSDDIAILSEERCFEGFEKGKPFLIVDPVDGSSNYEKGSPLFCVSIAGGILHSECKYSDIVFGIIASPHFGTWSFKERRGVYHNGSRLRKPEPKSPSIARIPTLDYDGSIKQVCLGSTALEFCFLSKGYIDFFVEYYPRKIFDFAAGYGIIRELGGNSWDCKGQNYNSKKLDVVCDEGLISSFFSFDEIKRYL
jgi:fructose-1,6-bisphosphatase/inositol monophosphatase family enzyme